MIVRDGTAIEGAHFADAGISYSCRKISKTEAVERLVVEKQIVSAVADIVCGKNRPTPDRVLNFQIPLHKLSVGEVAAYVVERRNQLSTAGRAGGGAIRSRGHVGIEGTAGIKIVGEQGITVLDCRYTAARKCRGCGRLEIPCYRS